MRKQIIDRDAGLEVHAAAHGKPPHVVSTQRVAHEAVHQVVNVRVQNARHELLPQEVEVSAGEVKQRTDVRIVLTVVVAERTLVIALQLGNPVVRTH